jgi:probable rRNA maturation factor
MEIDVLTEDDAWHALPEREALAARAARAVFDVLEVPEPQSELSIVFTSDAVVADLNRQWRGKAKPTNVLSFPAAAAGVPPGASPALGDIVLAAGVVSAEAHGQGKPLANHAAHLIIHGVLHLLGHDHGDDETAEAMERLEARAMARLGLPDPYGEPDEDAIAPGPNGPGAAG